MGILLEHKAFMAGRWLFDPTVHGPEATYDARVMLTKLGMAGLPATIDTLGEAQQGFEDARDAHYRK